MLKPKDFHADKIFTNLSDNSVTVIFEKLITADTEDRVCFSTSFR